MFSPPKPTRLKRFPWATFGRSEMPAEFFQKVEEQRQRVDLFSDPPRFTIIALLDSGSSVEQAGDTWESLLLQSYPNWEVYVVGTLSEWASLRPPGDARFHFIECDSPLGWIRKNRALEKIPSGWVGVVGIGDVLSPSAFFQFALEIERSAGSDGFYTNEAVMGEGASKVTDFFSKCAWSPLTLLHWNYVGRLWIARRDRLGAFEQALCGEEEHQALLAIARKAGTLSLVPQYLYYRRKRQPVRGLACPPPFSGQSVLVSAVICFRNRGDYTRRALESLIACRGETSLEVVLVNNDSSPTELAKIEPILSTYPLPVRLVDFPGPFNYGRMHNWAVREHCRGGALLLLNNDVFLQPSVDLGAWAKWVLVEQVATVGILLRFAHGGVQHSGLRAWFGGEARLARVGNSHAEDALVFENREVFANTFAACMVKRSVFDAVGGLREKDLANGFGDVAFCFECIRKGWRHLYLGSMEGIHLESSSRGNPYEYWEECAIEREYPDILQRMLRQDLGINRVPGNEYAIRSFLWQAIKIRFRRRSRWLDPLKPTAKKWLRRWSVAKDNG